MTISEFISQIRWRPQIGDASFVGWLTVAAYGVAAVLCVIAAYRQIIDPDVKDSLRRRRVWLGVAVLMILLGLNKQLDLQSLFTELGRALARSEGWYGQRRAIQRWFILIVAAAGALALTVVTLKARSVLRKGRTLWLGLAFLLTFIIIRAASFHHVDVLIRSQILGVRISWILELAGISLIGISAARSAHSPWEG